MKAILLLFSAVALFAMDYESFKQKALEEANILKIQKLSMEATRVHTDILEQTLDPTLELSGSRYDDESGWKAGIIQPIKVFGLGDLATAKEQEAKADFVYLKAKFWKNLELLFTRYIYQKKLEVLLNDELVLASRLESITKQRLKNGVTTKAKYLMATLEKEDVLYRLKEQKLNITISYFDLMMLANIDKDIQLDSQFIYPLSQTMVAISSNPKLLLAQKKQNTLQKKVESLDHSIKTVNLIAEYEKEPEGDIKTLGVEFALPLFGNSSQEGRLAKIKAKQHQLQIEMLKTNEQLSQKRLKQTLENLKIQFASMNRQLEKQKNLLELFEEGYKISKGSLLELIGVKNHLIRNKRKLLEIQKNTNLKQIELNFIQGAYNE